MVRANRPGGPLGPKPSKTDADRRDLAILRDVADGVAYGPISQRRGVSPPYISKLLREGRRDAAAPMGRNQDVRAMP